MKLELVYNFNYLGLIINFNGSFKLAITELKNKASRAMYELIGKCRKLGLSIDLQLELFDRMIVRHLSMVYFIPCSVPVILQA